MLCGAQSGRWHRLGAAAARPGRFLHFGTPLLTNNIHFLYIENGRGEAGCLPDRGCPRAGELSLSK